VGVQNGGEAISGQLSAISQRGEHPSECPTPLHPYGCAKGAGGPRGARGWGGGGKLKQDGQVEEGKKGGFPVGAGLVPASF